MLMRHFCIAVVLAGYFALSGGFAFSAEPEKTQPRQNATDKEVKVYGPGDVMDTSPIMVVEAEDEPAMTAAEQEEEAKIPLAQRLAKYDVLAGDALRAGEATPYQQGKILGNPKNMLVHDYFPFLWEARGENAQRWQWQLADRGGYEANDALRFTGSTDTRPAWRSREMPVTPGGFYRLSVIASSNAPDGEYLAYGVYRHDNLAYLNICDLQMGNRILDDAQPQLTSSPMGKSRNILSGEDGRPLAFSPDSHCLACVTAKGICVFDI